MSTPPHAEKGSLPVLLGKFWTVANMLSLARLIIAPPVAYLILTDGPQKLMWGLMTLGILTDWFDGHVARWSRTVSSWGKVLDPLADKVAAAVIVLALVILGTLPTWFVVLIVARDVIIVLGGIVLARRTSQVVMSIWWGKVAVAALSLTVLAALLRADADVMQILLWTTVALLVFSFALYMARFIRLYRSAPVERPDDTRPALRPEDGREMPEMQPDAYADRR